MLIKLIGVKYEKIEIDILIEILLKYKNYYSMNIIEYITPNDVLYISINQTYLQ